MSSSPPLPRALPWTLLDYGSDLIVVIGAMSDICPSTASISELPQAPPVREGHASSLALRLVDDLGRARSYAMDAISDPDRDRLLDAPSGSVVVVEEDAAAIDGRRHAYVATIRRMVADTEPVAGPRR